MLLVVERPDEVCDGKGEVLTDEWERMANESENEDPEDFFLEKLGFASVPPMYRTCGNCEGSGRVEARLDVSELLAELTARLRRPLVPPEELRTIMGNLRTTMKTAADRAMNRHSQDDPTDDLRTVQEAAASIESVGRLRGGIDDDL